MDSLDLFVRISLQNDFGSDPLDNGKEPQIAIPFGHVAFINEKFWKTCPFYMEPKETRLSHPGLSLSKNSSNRKVAFGSSKTGGRDKTDRDLFFVSPSECTVLSRDVVFLLKSSAPATIFNIDFRKSDTAPLCRAKMQELKKRSRV